jgi:hypothetical protein
MASWQKCWAVLMPIESARRDAFSTAPEFAIRDFLQAPIFWLLLPAFIVAGTPVEIAESPTLAGYAMLARSFSAMFVMFGIYLKFSPAIAPSAIIPMVLFCAYWIGLNLVELTPSAFMAASTMASGGFLAFMAQGALQRSLEVRRFLYALVTAYLAFHLVGLATSLFLWSVSGQLIDLHSIVFPFSAARIGEMQGNMRLTGFHLEPGTYANATYLFVFVRVLLRGRVFSTFDALAILSTIMTFAAWSVVGCSLYFIAVIIETLSRDRLLGAGIRLAIFTLLTLLAAAVLPAALPGLADLDYIRLIAVRFSDSEASGSTALKVEAFYAWLGSISPRWLLGHSLPDTFCTYCSSVQDLGLAFNAIFYLGAAAFLPVALVCGRNLLMRGGLAFAIVAVPFLFSKFYFYDFQVWLALGMIISRGKIWLRSSAYHKPISPMPQAAAYSHMRSFGGVRSAS